MVTSRSESYEGGGATSPPEVFIVMSEINLLEPPALRLCGLPLASVSMSVTLGNVEMCVWSTVITEIWVGLRTVTVLLLVLVVLVVVLVLLVALVVVLLLVLPEFAWGVILQPLLDMMRRNLSSTDLSEATSLYAGGD